MPRNFARHEQLLRIFALLDILTTVRQPLDDQALIEVIKERLGLRRLSPRTLHRDCNFLITCGYPIDHVPVPGGRRQGWLLNGEILKARRMPAEPLTMLELVAFTIGRDLMQPFMGTVLWTGIESLRRKLEATLPAGLLDRLQQAKVVFHVVNDNLTRYAARPRLISAISKAITDCREIEVTTKPVTGPSSRHRLRPLRLVIEPPRVRLLALEDGPAPLPPVLIDLERVESVTPRDMTFVRPSIDAAETIARAVMRP